jgi:hypothetical protein
MATSSGCFRTDECRPLAPALSVVATPSIGSPTPYRWFRISPRRIQAWREVNELPDRELMRDGRWLV